VDIKEKVSIFTQSQGNTVNTPDTPKKKPVITTPRGKPPKTNANMSFQEPKTAKVAKSQSRKSFDFSEVATDNRNTMTEKRNTITYRKQSLDHIGAQTPKNPLTKKNSTSKFSLRKQSFDDLGSPNNLKRKTSGQNFDIKPVKPDRSGSAAKKSTPNVNLARERSSSKQLKPRERSLSRNKNLKINTKDEQDPMSMTMTNQFGVTSTIMKVDFSKTLVPKKTVAKKKKINKSKSKIKNIEDEEKLKEKSVEKVDKVEKTIESNMKLIKDSNKKVNANKKKPKKPVTYEIKNLHEVNKTGDQVGIVVKKDVKKAVSPKKEKKVDKFENLKKKLNKMNIICEQPKNNMEKTTPKKSRLEQIDFTKLTFSTPKNKKCDPVINDKLILTERRNSNTKKCRVENISKMLQKHNKNSPGESPATSSDSVSRISRHMKKVPSYSNIPK